MSKGGSACHCTALATQPQNSEDAYAKVPQEHQFERGVACPCSFYSRERGIWIVVFGDDFMSGGPKHQLNWLKGIMNEYFESKHTMVGRPVILVNRW